ncbi:hypothetical protein GU926_10220 [Nibribacter ruber]|uniref:Uncharacterized protein n=1 Tax=Nibribacter ruber TaxID=2698458 RepID=A0A6P1P1J9_9BACT|nr:hypothetical protein [Nibribacter ruber]QHL87783.1 hypothetical protein GU926_10220 [Nibribacter ruber]
MPELSFPLEFTFKTPSLANKITVKDTQGLEIFSVHQVHSDVLSESSLLNIDPFLDEAFVYTDASEAHLRYSIKAYQSKEFYASFMFTDHENLLFGHIVRRHWDYVLRAHYSVFDQYWRPVFTIKEADVMTRVHDTMLGRIPFISLLTGYFFNPSYYITRPDGSHVATVTKEKSFLSSRFTLTQAGPCTPHEQERLLLSTMLLVLQERRRG